MELFKIQCKDSFCYLKNKNGNNLAFRQLKTAKRYVKLQRELDEIINEPRSLVIHYFVNDLFVEALNY